MDAAVRNLKGCHGEEGWLESDRSSDSYVRDLRSPIGHTLQFTKEENEAERVTVFCCHTTDQS